MENREIFICRIVFFLHVSSSFVVLCVWMGSHSDNLANAATTRHDINRTSVQENCPAKCKCSFSQSFVSVNCNGINLKSLPDKFPTNTEQLSLNSNNLTKLDTLSYPLIYLHTLDITENNISHIKKELFTLYIPSLYSLNVSNNFLHSVTLENLFLNISSLHVLNISRNRLDRLSPHMFQNLIKLKILDVSYNEITEIDYYTFHLLGSLQFLDLTGNQIYVLKHSWFQNLDSLSTLILRQNRLNSVDNLIFSTLHQLRYLDLSENNILSIGLLSFKGLVNLRYLNISSNNISLVQKSPFQLVDKLESVDFSCNPLTTIDNLFVYSSQVKYLKLAKTRLKSLTSNSLSGLSNLQHLQISSSPNFSFINGKVFETNSKLRILNLNNNNLSTLSSETLNSLTRLKMLRLDGNPWRCSCHIYWLLLWLQNQVETHLQSPDQTFCYSPSSLRGHALIDALDHRLKCSNATIREYTKITHFTIGSNVILRCVVEGNPNPLLTWITPHKLVFHWSEQCCNISECNITSCNFDHPSIHYTDDKPVLIDALKRFFLLKNGNLLIRNVDRKDTGFYHCIASNPVSNQTVTMRLTLDHGFLNHIKIVSILVGLATSFGFLFLTLFCVFIQLILNRCGVECPCSTSPKSQQIKRILDGMEHYKRQQLERLRENYNFQVQRIKDNCMQQMERLRESYSSQIERLRDIRDYGTLQIDRIRENYYLQVQRVRDYSASQIDRLRENYFFQRSRIRKFSAHQLYKLRENYKLQQQHFNKIFENLNIESCRNVCARTDSIMFEPEITVEPIFATKICALNQLPYEQRIDSGDNSSQISAYFTPDEEGSEVSSPDGDSNIGIKSEDIANTQDETEKEMKDIGMSNLSKENSDLHSPAESEETSDENKQEELPSPHESETAV